MFDVFVHVKLVITRQQEHLSNDKISILDAYLMNTSFLYVRKQVFSPFWSADRYVHFFSFLSNTWPYYWLFNQIISNEYSLKLSTLILIVMVLNLAQKCHYCSHYRFELFDTDCVSELSITICEKCILLGLFIGRLFNLQLPLFVCFEHLICS